MIRVSSVEGIFLLCFQVCEIIFSLWGENSFRFVIRLCMEALVE